MINIIVAMSRNRVIGKNNQLPWKIKKDMQRFKKITTGNIVVMGRKTYDSIGKPLPNRINIVLTRDPDFNPKGVLVYNDIEECINYCKSFDTLETFIIGGEQIYRQTLKYAQRILITQIDKEIDGDAYFPDLINSTQLDMMLWVFVGKKHTDEESGLEFEFLDGEEPSLFTTETCWKYFNI